MGSPGSPAYATCICMYYEHLLIQHIKQLQINIPTNKQQSIHGKRYIDDVISFIPYDATNIHSIIFAKKLLKMLKNTYHKEMILKEEPFINNKTHFLETEVIYNYATNQIDIKHHDKNFKSLYNSNEFTKIKTIHATSFGPKEQPTNIILNTLHRIQSNCTTNHYIKQSTLEHFYVQAHLGYNFNHFKQALKKINKTTNSKIWKDILHDL